MYPVKQWERESPLASEAQKNTRTCPRVRPFPPEPGHGCIAVTLIGADVVAFAVATFVAFAVDVVPQSPPSTRDHREPLGIGCGLARLGHIAGPGLSAWLLRRPRALHVSSSVLDPTGRRGHRESPSRWHATSS